MTEPVTEPAPEPPTDPRLTAPSASRNRDPILDSLASHLPASGLVLEIASGTGEHVAHFAARLPHLQWQPSDPDAERRASIGSWATGLPNVRPALALDATAPHWPIERAAAVLCINMIHIAPPAATHGLIAGAASVLAPGGLLALYGPFRRAGRPMEPGNAAFDANLRARNPAWGLRVLEDIAALAHDGGFGGPLIQPMPADNLLVLFRRT